MSNIIKGSKLEDISEQLYLNIEKHYDMLHGSITHDIFKNTNILHDKNVKLYEMLIETKDVIVEIVEIQEPLKEPINTDVLTKIKKFILGIFCKRGGGSLKTPKTPKQVKQLMNKFVKHVEMEHPRIMKNMIETEELSKATEEYLYKSFIKKNPTIEKRMNKLAEKMANL